MHESGKNRNLHGLFKTVFFQLSLILLWLSVNPFILVYMKKMLSLFWSVSLVIALQAQEQHHPDPVTLAIGSPAPDFNLKGTDGRMHSLGDYASSPVLVVIFSANHCPTAQAYEDRIMDIARDYKSKGVQVVVISSNSAQALNLSEMGYSDLGDSFGEMVIRAKDKGFNFPYLYDGDDQKIALQYGPVATPHAFVFDRDRLLRYCGRIDHSEKPGTGHGEDLRLAIDQALAGKQTDPAVTKVFGCSIKWSWKSAYTEKLYKDWAALPVTLDSIGPDSVKNLMQNHSEKLRLINVWATWCGPCVNEFPDFITIDRMYRGRDFEFISISADKLSKKDKVLEFLIAHQASNKNYIFNQENVYDLIEAVDPNWQGALPYTILVEPGGKIVYGQQGPIDPLRLKKLIVENHMLGRTY